jgi:hypothetical protein
MGTRGLHLKLTSGETYPAVVTCRKGARPLQRRRPVPEFFIHAMRNKLAVITTASDSWRPDRRRAADRCKLTSIIVSEAAELERLIDGLDLLAGVGHAPADRYRWWMVTGAATGSDPAESSHHRRLQRAVREDDRDGARSDDCDSG